MENSRRELTWASIMVVSGNARNADSCYNDHLGADLYLQVIRAAKIVIVYVVQPIARAKAPAL